VSTFEGSREVRMRSCTEATNKKIAAVTVTVVKASDMAVMSKGAVTLTVPRQRDPDAGVSRC
jgi:hypothetical protein